MCLFVIEEYREHIIGMHPLNEKVISEHLAIGVLVVLNNLIQILETLDLPVEELRTQTEQTQVQLHVLCLYFPLVLGRGPSLQVVDALHDALQTLPLHVPQNAVGDVL